MSSGFAPSDPRTSGYVASFETNETLTFGAWADMRVTATYRPADCFAFDPSSISYPEPDVVEVECVSPERRVVRLDMVSAQVL